MKMTYMLHYIPQNEGVGSIRTYGTKFFFFDGFSSYMCYLT